MIWPRLHSPTRTSSTSRIGKSLVTHLPRPFPIRFLSDSTSSPCNDTSSSQAGSSGAAGAVIPKETTEIWECAPIPSPPEALNHFLTEEDIDHYVKPMITRKWAVLQNNGQLNTKKDTLFFAKEFKFTGYDATMSFINDIASIVREENHHPEVAFDYVTVKVQTQTHRIANSAFSVRCADGKIPGITRKDLRLAIRIEKLFTEVYLSDGRGLATGKKGREQVLETLATTVGLEMLSIYSGGRVRPDRRCRNRVLQELRHPSL